MRCLVEAFPRGWGAPALAPRGKVARREARRDAVRYLTGGTDGMGGTGRAAARVAPAASEETSEEVECPRPLTFCLLLFTFHLLLVPFLDFAFHFPWEGV